ncbi:hypothetical protein D3C85_1431360 [compost metagenome]
MYWLRIFLSGLFYIGIQVFYNSFNQGMGKSAFYAFFPPFFISDDLFALRFNRICKFNQSFCRIFPAIQQYIFYTFQKFRWDLLVNFQHSCVYNSHVQACFDGMV